MRYLDRAEHSAHQHGVENQSKAAPPLDTVVIKSVHSEDGYQIIDAADFDPETMELFHGMFRQPGK